VPLASSTLPHRPCVLFPQRLSWVSMHVPMLLVEVARVREAVIVADAAHIVVVLAMKT
jgi:hypothetical protein